MPGGVTTPGAHRTRRRSAGNRRAQHDQRGGQPRWSVVGRVIQTGCGPTESGIVRRAVADHRVECVDGAVPEDRGHAAHRRPQQRRNSGVRSVLGNRFHRGAGQSRGVELCRVAAAQCGQQPSGTLDIVAAHQVTHRQAGARQGCSAQRYPRCHRCRSGGPQRTAPPHPPGQHGGEQTHCPEQEADVGAAADPAAAVADPPHRRCRDAEPCDRMTRPRVGQHEVGQIAGQHTDDPGMPRRAKHSGSVSHVVYSVDGAFWCAFWWARVAMKRHAARAADLLNPAAVLLPAANVIMQLSLPGVGYGVLESPVDSGNVYKHPFKRARTTGMYLAVATIGTESDRELIRAAVDTAHRQVRSTSSSPVSYNAFDPMLQLWVAACLYRYFIDQHESLYGPLDEATADAVYLDAKRLGTTLQVREGMWPPDRVAFDDYWKRSLEDLRIDPPVREHLHGVATMAFLPRPLHALAGPFNLFATTGFLAPGFRSMMQLQWAQSEQRRFEWLLAALRLADRLIPHQAWILGYRLYLWDMRFRARRGWRIV